MRRSAVIFVLIFTLLFTSVVTGCGAGSDSGTGNPSGSAGEAGQSAPSESSGKTGESGKTDDAGSSDASGKSDAAGKTGGASSIPDTNETAASDWGVSDTGTADNSADAQSTFSQVLVDTEDLYFAIKQARTDAALGYEWKVYIENRTDQNLMFSFEKVSVNGVMCDPFWAEVITAGKKGNCEITWMRDSFAERGIEDVAQVDFTLNVYNDDDYTQAPLMRDPFTVYPLGEDHGYTAVRESAETDHVLVDDENCSVIITGYDPDNSWGYAMHLYLVNKTDHDLVFSVNDSSVNGIMCDPFWAEIVCAGKSAYSTVLWDHNSLEENDIAKIEQISLPLTVYSDENIANPYVDETFELTPGTQE